ncbi:MAG: TonB-dependent receptor [Parasphingorhabdus sp.]
MAHKFFGKSLVFGSSALALAMPAYGQVTENAASNDGNIIIVTAQKRGQNLQDVPISIEAVAGDKIIEQSVVRLDQLDDLIPNLAITEGATGNTINIRGIGTAQGNAGFEQSVATFVDGVYVGRSRQSVNPLMDIARVEVLRGPQPVYFGQNAIAGALSITTRDGTGPFEVNATASYASDNEIIFEGGVTVPLVEDRLGVRLAGRYTDYDGYITNLFTGEDEAGLQTDMFRATVNFQSEFLDLELKYEHGESTQTGLPAETVNCGAGGPVPGAPPVFFCQTALATFPQIAGAFDPLPNQNIAVGGAFTAPRPGNPSQPVTADIFQGGPDQTTTDLIAATADMDLGPATLTLIGAHTEYSYDAFRDLDATPFALLHPRLFEDYKQFSLEARLTSNEGLFDGFLDYLIGYYYQDAEIRTRNQTYALLGPFANGTTFESDETYNTFFLGLTANVSDNFRINLGGRYSDVDKMASTGAIRAPISPAGLGAPFAPIFPAGCPGGVVQSPPNPATGARATLCATDSFETDDFSFQIGAQYEVNPDFMVFATYTEGFKAGGFVQSGQGLPAGANAASVLDSFQFDNETVENIELGFKARLFDGRLRLNATAFHTDFSNLQVSSFDVANQTFRTENAASATSQGIEIDGDIEITEGLKFTFSGSILDAEFNDYPGAQCGQVEQNMNLFGCTYDANGDGIQNNQPGGADIVGTTNRAGFPLLFSPDWQLNVGLRYDGDIGDSLRFGIGGDVAWTDDYQTSDRYDTRGINDSFARVNLRAEIGSQDGLWTLAAFGNNITDRQPLVTFGPSQLGGQLAGFAVTSKGESYGIQLRIKYGGK